MVKMVTTIGVIEENAYFYIDEASGHGFLIDPGAEAGKLLDMIRDGGWTIEKILLTHGHFDHIGAVNKLREVLDVPVIAHEDSDQYLLRPDWNLSANHGIAMMVEDAVKVREGDVVSTENGALSMKVIHTPGHTTDSVIYYDEKAAVAFTGDTIFKANIGNYMLPGGDYKTLCRSIIDKVLTLPEETALYSGHSDVTTVQAEKRRYRL